MKLSDETKSELKNMILPEEFKGFKKTVFVKNPGSREAVNQYTDFLQFFHDMAGHPQKKFKPIKGKFLL